MDSDELKEKLGMDGDGTYRINPDTGVVQESTFTGWRDTDTRVDPDSGVVQESTFTGWRDTDARVDPDSGVVQESGFIGWHDTDTRVDPDSGAIQESGFTGWRDTDERLNPETGELQERGWTGWKGGSASRPSAGEPSGRTTGSEAHQSTSGGFDWSSSTSRNDMYSSRASSNGDSDGGFGLPLAGLVALVFVGVLVAGQGTVADPSTAAPAEVADETVRPEGTPPSTLVQIHQCLLYKCGGDSIVLRADTELRSEPRVDAEAVGTLAAGSELVPDRVAQITVQPGIYEAQQAVPRSASTGGQFSLKKGERFWVYANWGEGCRTVWASGAIYGAPPSERYDQLGRNGVGCVMLPEAIVEIVPSRIDAWLRVTSPGGVKGWLPAADSVYSWKT
jgi:hypothetical protein